jgi:hypothetical protein
MCVAKSLSLVVSYRVLTAVASASVSMKRVNVTRTLAASNVTRMSDASGYSTRSAARSAALSMVTTVPGMMTEEETE